MPRPASYARRVGIDAWGIDDGFTDAWGGWRTPGAASRAALRTVMGGRESQADAGAPPPGGALVVVTPWSPWEPDRPGTLVLEDGTEVAVDGMLPPDLPLGYHRFVADHGSTTTVIASPGRCASNLPERAWGVTAQLYAARSSRSWGLGDLADLHTLVRWTTARGGEVVGLNPLHASTPQTRPPDSPYSPSSRRYRDPLYLSVPHVAAAHGVDHDPSLTQAAAEGRALDRSPRIDRSAVWAHKRWALEEVWEQVHDRADVRARVDTAVAADPDLHLWGTYCVLADRHGPAWPAWPMSLRRPDAPAVADAARLADADVRFWMWLQVLVADQLRAAGGPSTVVTDLAVGFAADGFDAWQWQDLLALDARIGAPPDLLGPDGQDWGLPPFVPWRLRDAAYQPVVATLRAAFAHARGVRIDHVMGLSRLFWIPPGFGPADGAYVHHRGTELLDVLALESVRAGGFVVGEDLGTVEDALRTELARRGVLSTRLLWFEDEPPERWPVEAMAAVTTHDLPTVAGVWSGLDRADQVAAGFGAPPEADAEMRHHLRVASSLPDDANEADVAVGVHRRLAGAGSRLATATLDDLAGSRRRPNLPGTIDEHPNWRLPLPRPLDEVLAAPLADRIATALATGRTTRPEPPEAC